MKTYIYLDSAKIGLVALKVVTPEGEYKVEKEQKFGSQALLGAVEEVITKAGIDLQELEEIKVNTGPGSFTGLRVGISVANALGFSLQLPVNGKRIETNLVYQ